MDPFTQESVSKLKRIQTTFREKYSVLLKAKEAVLTLFRQKLEKEKMEELRKKIYELGK